jgi:hypothetical protein
MNDQLFLVRGQARPVMPDRGITRTPMRGLGRPKDMMGRSLFLGPQSS